jgi:hypothetical protein
MRLVGLLDFCFLYKIFDVSFSVNIIVNANVFTLIVSVP